MIQFFNNEVDNELLTKEALTSVQYNTIRNFNSTDTPDEFNEMVCGPLNRLGLFCSEYKTKAWHSCPL